MLYESFHEKLHGPTSADRRHSPGFYPKSNWRCSNPVLLLSQSKGSTSHLVSARKTPRAFCSREKNLLSQALRSHRFCQGEKSATAMTRRAFLFGSRVIRDLLGASCSDASTTALSPNRAAVSMLVCCSMPICLLGIAVAFFSLWRNGWPRNVYANKFCSGELKALRVFLAETRLTVCRPRQ